MKDRNLSVSKLRHFLHSNISDSKCYRAQVKSREWKKLQGSIMIVVPWIWRLLKTLTCRASFLFDSNVDLNGIRKRDSKVFVWAFSTLKPKIIRSRSFCPDEGTKAVGHIKNPGMAGEIRSFNTKNTTTAAFAERAVRLL